MPGPLMPAALEPAASPVPPGARPEPARRAVPHLAVIVPCYQERGNVAPLVAGLDSALRDVAWEAVFVDDDSPDGTGAEVRRIAAADPRVRLLRRIGRRGLSSAAIEGMLSVTAPFVAVMDGDLQHDPALLPAMLDAADGPGRGADLVIGSRFAPGGNAAGLADGRRRAISGAGTRLARMLLRVPVSDPMSGYFLLRRETFEAVAPALSGQGFKILLDILLSAPAPLRTAEIPIRFGERLSGDSKLDLTVLLQFLALLAEKLSGGLVPLRFVSFALVGLLGVGLHLAVLTAAIGAGAGFGAAQLTATLTAMAGNFWLNNAITYRQRRLRGPAFARGLLLFMAVCGLGAAANIGIARALFASDLSWRTAGVAGAAVGVVWNYAVSSTLVWRVR